MKSSKFWLAVLVAGIVANALDYLVYGVWLSEAYFKQNTQLFNQSTANVPWFIFGDFVGVLVFAWVLDKVSGSFGSTPKDGAIAGLYFGILVNFPMNIFLHLMFNGYPYSLSWIGTIYGIIWYISVGAILAAMMKKGPSKS